MKCACACKSNIDDEEKNKNLALGSFFVATFAFFVVAVFASLHYASTTEISYDDSLSGIVLSVIFPSIFLIIAISVLVLAFRSPENYRVIFGLSFFVLVTGSGAIIYGAIRMGLFIAEIPVRTHN